ncbi:response regulator [Citreimonas salinaria]|uniref:Response regulator receiver domain-containing protein n=1 Tax=Citreimonas salinaria TaxID=321339 RepID=A0A1H3FB40_9RHOB|nr:response regulator [Citreimonas salinaria]SDX87578.1 Response regulator receiver domain-containing protein [Citreimonas salinaria]
MPTRPRRVLLVEDEMLIAMEMEDLLVELGFEVVGPAMRLKRAAELAARETLDFALLDINLASETSFPVARLLRARQLPFAFVTGYGVAGLTDEFKDTPTLQKPVDRHHLQRVVRAISEAAR